MVVRSHHAWVAVVAVLLAAAVPSVHAVTIRVDHAGGGDHLTIQDGIAAATAGDTVLVWPGVYTEYVEMASSADGVILRSFAGPSVTTINGSSVDSRITVSCKHLSTGARIEGFRVTGTSTATSVGVMDVYQSTLEVHSCVITEGAGLNGIAAQFSDVSIVGCTISGVGAPDSPGGAVYADNSHVCITNSDIIGNTAREGGAISGFQLSALELVGNTIASNTATQGAAAIDLWNPGPVHASGNSFVGNAAAPYGAATVYVYGSVDELVFTDNVFFGNTVSGGLRRHSGALETARLHAELVGYNRSHRDRQQDLRPRQRPGMVGS